MLRTDSQIFTWSDLSERRPRNRESAVWIGFSVTPVIDSLVLVMLATSPALSWWRNSLDEIVTVGAWVADEIEAVTRMLAAKEVTRPGAGC